MSAPRAIQNYMRKVLGDSRTTPLEGFAPHVTPDPENMLDVYALMEGPEDTPYAGGIYLMLVKCPEDFPFAAPVVKVLTPSGRFEPNRALCIAGVTHMHAEQWVPKQLVQILTSVRMFMATEPEGPMSGVGGMTASEDERKLLARQSRAWCVADAEVNRLFPDFVEEERPKVAAALRAQLAEAEDETEKNALASRLAALGLD